MTRVRTEVPGAGTVRQNQTTTPVRPQQVVPPSTTRPQVQDTPTDYGSQERSTVATGDRQVPLSRAMRERGQQPGSVYAFTEQTPGHKVATGAGRVGLGLL